MSALPSLRTPLTRLLRTPTPLILANMNLVSSPILATSITQSGGFGFWALDACSSIDQLSSDLQWVKDQLHPGEGEALPIGVGAIGWTLDAQPAPSPSLKLLEHALLTAPGVKAVWLSFSLNLLHWVQHVRSLDAQRADGRKTLIFLQVSTLEQAREARDMGADVIVAQGREAGGHSWAAAPGTFTLVSQVLQDLSEGKREGERERPLVVAAGGIASGKQAAAYLALGADGVAVGTLFAATEESSYPSSSKETLVRASGSDVLRTTLWDKVQGRPWPEGVTGSAVRNQLVEDEKEGKSLEEIKGLYAKDVGGGRGIVWAGSGVGAVKGVRPAKDVFVQLWGKTADALRETGTLIEG